MIELTGIVSIFIFVLYVMFILVIMLFISSILAAIIMLLIPVLLLFASPETMVKFLAYRQAEFLNGTFTINNLHLLLFIWSTMLGIIIYVELISWYVSRKIEPKRPEETLDKKPGQVNIPFKSLERFLQKFEEMISGKK